MLQKMKKQKLVLAGDVKGPDGSVVSVECAQSFAIVGKPYRRPGIL